MRASFGRVLPIIVVSLLVLLLPRQPSQADANLPQDEQSARAILLLINGWRMTNGAWPLQVNPTLVQMALDQANYVSSLPQIPAGEQIHVGRFGEMPPERAVLPPYNWPSYANAANTAVGEITYVGATTAAAMNFWANSTVHRNTALNTAYREVGVAAIPNKLGHMYVVVFGSRPDILPVTADLQNKMLYLSNERYRWARAPYLLNVRQVRLFDANGRPLGDWVSWSSSLPLPDHAGDQLTVAYQDDNGVMALATVSLSGDNTATVPEMTATPTSTPTATATFVRATVAPTATSAAGRTATATSAVSSGNPAPTATASPNVVSSSGSGMVLLYDRQSFTIWNNTGSAANVAEVVFAGAQTSFAVARWNTQWLSGSLSALGASDCLEVWSWDIKDTLAKPASCRTRRGVITISPTQTFWTQGDFEVRLRDAVLATCSVSATRCEFGLP